MTNRNLQEQIEALNPWFHNVHLGCGVQTAPEHPLGDFPAFKWAEIAQHLPPDLRNKTALDIGCNAGFYSFELARRGAQVTAIDHDPHYLRQARWACQQLGLTSNVTFERTTVYDLARSEQQFDLVWFMGVFYHLRYPLLALDIIRRLCRGQMVFQTLTSPDTKLLDVAADYALNDRELLAAKGWPKLSFIEHSFAGDPTNWWAANDAAVLALLRAAGFDNIRQIADETYLCDTRPSAVRAPIPNFHALFPTPEE